MRIMIRLLTALTTLSVVGHGQVLAQANGQQSGPATRANAAGEEFATISEANERAFSFDIPKSWQPNSGVASFGPQTSLWMTATSPDHQSGIFLGDPNRQFFHAPGPGFSNGQVISNPLGRLKVMPYQSASEFVGQNGQRLLPSDAQNVRLESVKEETELAAKRTAAMSGTGAIVTAATGKFSFEQNGVPKIASVTMQVLRNPNGAWSEMQATGYYSKPADENRIREIYERSWHSLKPDPQWMAENNRKVESQVSAVFNQQREAGNAMLRQQAESSNRNLNAMHEMGMQRLDAIGERGRQQAAADADWHNNQMVNHYAQMAAKDNNNYHEVLMIQNKHLEWSPQLQRNVEVPNY
jgi:hypothetical protein